MKYQSFLNLSCELKNTMQNSGRNGLALGVGVGHHGRIPTSKPDNMQGE